MPSSALFSRAVRELVIANHILAMEEVLDAMGHVSVRNPDDPSSFLLSRSRSPEFVTEDDIVVHDRTGQATGIAEPDLYRERFIHSAIYESRPDVHAVIHSHAHDVLPFTVSSVPLRAIVHDASSIGADGVPVWDIRSEFGDTKLLVSNMDQGRSLSRSMGDGVAVLMRGHGFSAAGKTLINVLKTAVYLPRNARVLIDAIHLGGSVTPLSDGEVRLRDETDQRTPAAQRQWEYWVRKLGEHYEPGGGVLS